MEYRRLYLILLFLTQGILAGDHEVRLIGKLREKYEAYERPAKDEHKPLIVEFQITLRSIIDVDEKNELINTNLWLHIKWTDYKLSWNSSEYGNITEIRMPEKFIWKPDIIMYNSADPAFDSSYPVNAVLYSDGTLSQQPPGIFTSRCPIDIKWFPFDEQKCILKFGSWTYDGTKIDLRVKGGETNGSIEGYTKNGEWDLLGLPLKRNSVPYDCCPDNPYIDITYTIQIRRRKLYYIVNMIIPCLMLAGLTLVTFTIPPDAGEKISFGVTILLSLTVFLLMVAEALPASSDAVPLIALYFSAVMLLNAASVIFTVLVLNYHHRTSETHTMPRWVKKGICEWLAWLLRLKRPGHSFEINAWCSVMRDSQDNGERDDNNRKGLLADDCEAFIPPPPVLNGIQDIAKQTKRSLDNHNSSDSMPSRCELRLRAIKKELKFITDKMKAQDEDDQITSDWKFAAAVIDRLLLWFFALGTVLASVSILLAAPTMFSDTVPLVSNT